MAGRTARSRVVVAVVVASLGFAAPVAGGQSAARPSTSSSGVQPVADAATNKARVSFKDFTVSFKIKHQAGHRLIVIRGHAEPPSGVSRKRACKGKVGIGAFVGARTVAAGTASLRRNCRYSGTVSTSSKLATDSPHLSSGLLSVSAHFRGNGSILPETVRAVKGAPKCSLGHARETIIRDDLFKKHLQPNGFVQGLFDPNTAFNPTTGEHAAWDGKKLQWIDPATQKPLSPAGTNEYFAGYFFKSKLQPAGFKLAKFDPTHAYNPKTKRDAVWDHKTLQWIDVKGGAVLAGFCGTGTAAFSAKIVSPGYDHTTPGDRPATYPSTVCFDLTTTKPKPGAAFTATIMPGGPAGKSRSTSGTLDKNGKAYVVFGIKTYGVYTVSATVTAGKITVDAPAVVIDAHMPPPVKTRSCAGGKPA